jgi:hypothetical protein
MNLPDPRHPWMRLTAAARRTADERDAAAPYGFATRIAALALAQEPRIFSVFERFALRAVAVSCLLAAVSAVVNYPDVRTPSPAVSSQTGEDEPGPADDALAAVLDFGD